MSPAEIQPITMLAVIATFFFGHFLLIGGGAYLVFWVFGRELFAHRRVQLRPRPAQPARELRYSTLSIGIFALASWGTWLLSGLGVGALYYDIDDYGIGYFVFSIAMLALIHDTYYYFAHRFMHHPKVFRHVHKLHHRFSNPTPFASYAFHPYEAIIEIAWLGPVALLLPIHPSAFAIYVVILTTLNVISHLGYEFYRPSVGKWFITSTHHNMHHSGSRGHFMLYFNFWDRLLGTNSVDYAARLREIAARPPAREPLPLFPPLPITSLN